MPRIKTTRTTAKRRLESSQKYYIRGATSFQDPFSHILGTMPEKILYARLLLMQIPFEFQSSVTVSIPELNILKDYRPDFILPTAKIIIEVQGTYFHSKPEAIEADSYKQALYVMMGYRVLAWWDYEIQTNLDALFARDIPQWTLPRGGRIIDPARQVIRDDLAGLRTQNAKKRKPYRTFVGTGKKSLRKVKSSYATR